MWEIATIKPHYLVGNPFTISPPKATNNQFWRVNMVVRVEGGPCHCCQATVSSLWYGRKNGPKYCRTNECLRMGGYLKPRVRSRLASAAAQRQRQPDDPDDPDENESMLSAGARISEIYACYGIRCARLRGIRLHVCELRLGPAQQ